MTAQPNQDHNELSQQELMALPQGDLRLLQTDLAQRLLASRQLARFAYVAKDGTPRNVPIAFAWNGSQIVMCTSKNAPKLPALRNNPTVALTIDTEVHPPKILLIRGRAELDFVDGIPDDFAFGELPEDWDHFMPFLEDAMQRIPALERVGIRKFFCGPESFTPDDRYHLGEAPELNAAQNDLLLYGALAAVVIFLLIQAGLGSIRLALLVFLLLPMALAGAVLAAFGIVVLAGTSFDRPPSAGTEVPLDPWVLGDGDPVEARVLVDAAQAPGRVRHPAPAAVARHAPAAVCRAAPPRRAPRARWRGRRGAPGRGVRAPAGSWCPRARRFAPAAPAPAPLLRRARPAARPPRSGAGVASGRGRRDGWRGSGRSLARRGRALASARTHRASRRGSGAGGPGPPGCWAACRPRSSPRSPRRPCPPAGPDRAPCPPRRPRRPSRPG